MAKSKKMSESKLTALLDGHIADAIEYESSELAGYRTKALEYCEGVMNDLPPEKGKSHVISTDISETLGWQMPSFMRVFLASDRIAIYEPATPGDEAFADQATDYVNHVFLRECNGYQVVYDSIYDGRLLGNGIIKHWWESKPEYKVETFTGLSEDAFIQLVSSEHVEEVLEHTQYDDPSGAAYPQVPGGEAAGLAALDAGGAGATGSLPDATAGDGQLPGAGGTIPGSGPPVGAPSDLSGLSQPAILHDCKLKICTRKGRLRIKALAPEHFLISRDATALDEENVGGFCAHREITTRSELIERGYDEEKVDDLPTYSVTQDNEEKSARDNLYTDASGSVKDTSTETVEVFECYVLCDYDGDGVAEWRQVIMGRGSKDKAHILANEEWGDDLPFSDIVPDPVPHRWRGRSVYDDLHQVQRISTALWRQTLNNLYLSNEPHRAVDLSQVNNPDDVVNPSLGTVISTKGPPAGIVQELVVPFVGDKSLMILQGLEEIKERRTGVSRSSMALDADKLQNQTATAAQIQQSAANSKVELMARNMAEMGFARLFRCLLKLIVKHQDREVIIRLRDEWVPMDPRAWDAGMDVSINIGLGTGSRERDFMAIQAVMTEQKLIIQTLGPSNPICDLKMFSDTLQKAAEMAGLRNPERFFSAVTDEEMQQIANAPKPPDPKVQELQMKMQMEQQKLQAQGQLEQQKINMQAQFEARQAEADIAVKQREAEFTERLELMRFELEKKLKQMELAFKREEHQLNLQAKQQQHVLAARDAQLRSQERAESHAQGLEMAERKAAQSEARP